MFLLQRKLYKKIISRIEILNLREQLYIYFSAKTIENWNFEFESVVNSIRLLSYTWKPLKIEISNLHAVQAWKLSEIEIFTHPEERPPYVSSSAYAQIIENLESWGVFVSSSAHTKNRNFEFSTRRETYSSYVSFSAQRSPYVKVENLNFPRVVKGIRLTFPPLCSWKSWKLSKTEIFEFLKFPKISSSVQR